MPELRSGVRRGRGRGQKAVESVKKTVKTRAAAAPKGRPRTRLAAKELQREEPLIAVPEPLIPIAEPLIPIAEPAKEDNKEEGVGAMVGGSGGLSANKGEEDANTPPFPEKVCDWDFLLVFYLNVILSPKVATDLVKTLRM